MANILIWIYTQYNLNDNWGGVDSKKLSDLCVSRLLAPLRGRARRRLTLHTSIMDFFYPFLAPVEESFECLSCGGHGRTVDDAQEYCDDDSGFEDCSWLSWVSVRDRVCVTEISIERDEASFSRSCSTREWYDDKSQYCLEHGLKCKLASCNISRCTAVVTKFKPGILSILFHYFFQLLQIPT